MNKKLLTAAIGAALAAGSAVAYADVKVGGHAQVEYFNSDSEVTGGAKSKGNGLIDNARGRFWITADEDLGGGLKALAHFEFSVDTANSGQSAKNGNGSLAFDSKERGFDARTREKYVGLAGGFGTIKAGNNHGAYKRMGGVRWDPFNATVLEARGNGGQSGTDASGSGFTHNAFIPGSIKWESAKLFGPVYAEVLYSPKKNDTGGTDTSGGNDFQAAVSFKPMKDLEIIAATSNNKKQPSLASASDQKANKIGARYSLLGAHTVWVQMEDVDINSDFTAPTTTGVTTASKGEAEYLWLGYSLKFGNNLFVAQLGEAEATAPGASKVEVEYRNLGVIHSFSKATSAWIGWRESEEKDTSGKAEDSVWSVGLRVNF